MEKGDIWVLFNAINANIKVGDTDMDYISFGNGQKNLIMIPGLGDALKTVKGTATAYAVMYREFQKTIRCMYSVEKSLNGRLFHKRYG